MSQKPSSRQQANQYDKIIKEHLEVTLPIIIRDVLGLDIVSSEEVPDDIQHTKERKPDSLKRVTDSCRETYMLQVEFQTEDEEEMVYRMADYSIMIMRKYRLPLKQYVVFLRDVKPSMPVLIDTEKHKFSYELISISDASYKLFLNSDNPEVKMLSILANFGKENAYSVVKTIVEEVRASASGDFTESRYFKQLRIFVQLRRSLEHELENVMNTIAKFFKEENDFLYRKGEARGEAKKSLEVVENLILKLGLSDSQAAEIAKVSVDLVKEVRLKLGK